MNPRTKVNGGSSGFDWSLSRWQHPICRNRLAGARLPFFSRLLILRRGPGLAVCPVTSTSSLTGQTESHWLTVGLVGRRKKEEEGDSSRMFDSTDSYDFSFLFFPFLFGNSGTISCAALPYVGCITRWVKLISVYGLSENRSLRKFRGTFDACVGTNDEQSMMKIRGTGRALYFRGNYLNTFTNWSDVEIRWLDWRIKLALEKQKRWKKVTI